jgi:hypothetical protein
LGSKLGSLSGRLGSAADKLRRLPDLAKGLGNGLRRGWDETLRYGKKLLDDNIKIVEPELPKLPRNVKSPRRARDDILW